MKPPFNLGDHKRRILEKMFCFICS